MSRFVALCLAVFLALSPLSLIAQEEAYPLTSSVIAGPGLEGLEIMGEPDEHGLIWHLKEPRRTFEHWTVLVYNAGDEPVSNVIVTIRYQMDGQWYLADLKASKRMLYPVTIQPGEFGFQTMGNIGGGQKPWDDAMIEVNSVTVGESSEFVSLGLEGVQISRNGYTGRFVNNTGVDVQDIQLNYGCVVDGKLVETSGSNHDLMVLEAGGKDAFEFRTTLCDKPEQTFFTALARVR